MRAKGGREKKCAVFPLIVTLLLLWLIPIDARADVRLPAIIGNGMVLQRAMSLTLWGWADPGEAVKIDFRGNTVRKVAGSDGTWSAKLPPQTPGGPFQLKIAGRNRITIEDVLVGDVWIASGQSNMEFTVAESDHAKEDMAGPHSGQLRLFLTDRQTALTPAPDVKSEGWQHATPRSVGRFSAIAFLFGRALEKRYHVPIGLLGASWGATHIESWMSADMLRPFPKAAGDLARIASFTANDVLAYNRYVEQYGSFMAAHASEDAGIAEGKAAWAQPGLDLANWGGIDLPRPYSGWGHDFKRFDGAVWYRHQVDVPSSVEGQAVELRLGVPYRLQRAFWNGVEVGRVDSAIASVYRIPPALVKSGPTTIAFRLEGTGGYIMIWGAPEQIALSSQDWRMPLAGLWRYRTAVDITALPEPPPAAQLLIPPGITVLWNGMISPNSRYALKGALWYQGEANVGAADVYGPMFRRMITGWREAWHQQFPFLYVQIAGYDGYVAPAAELREAQAAALSLPRTAMTTAADLGLADDVHPKDKRAVAARMVLAARHVAYGESVEYSGPTLRTVVRAGDRLVLTFDHLGGGLVDREGGKLRGFSIASAKGEFSPAGAHIEATTIIVSSPAVHSPMRVRYGWANVPNGTLGNMDGLPAAPFEGTVVP